MCKLLAYQNSWSRVGLKLVGYALLKAMGLNNGNAIVNDAHIIP